MLKGLNKMVLTIMFAVIATMFFNMILQLTFGTNTVTMIISLVAAFFIGFNSNKIVSKVIDDD